MSEKPAAIDPVEQTLGGDGVRGEAAVCPTGLTDAQPLQRPEPPTEGKSHPAAVGNQETHPGATQDG